MGMNYNTVSGIQDAWGKLSTRWQGEAASAFNGDYIVRLTEIGGNFDSACLDLSELSAECKKELDSFEQALAEE